MKAWKPFALSLALGSAAGFAGSALADATAEQTLWSEPAARAYLGLDFGGSRAVEQRLQYGLRLDRNSRADWHAQMPLAELAFDPDGMRSASLNGMPLLSREHMLRQNDGDTVYSWVDWGLVALGVAGIGYVIYEVADNDDEQEPQPVDDGGMNGGNGGDGGDGGGPLGGLLGGLLGFQSEPALTQSAYREWRDGGTGQMGDLD